MLITLGRGNAKLRDGNPDNQDDQREQCRLSGREEHFDFIISSTINCNRFLVVLVSKVFAF